MLYASRFLRLTEPNMTGPDVTALQRQLAQKGFYSGQIHSLYDAATAEAVKAFQQSEGITVDGIVGPDTWNALDMGQNSQTSDRTYRIVIDTEKFNLTLFAGGNVQAVYPVAVGKPSTPTPLGDWKITEKLVNPGGPFGARWMRINVSWGGYGIHGTDNPASIGTAASHGCVRLYNEDVIKLYDLVPIGTPVKITGGAFTGRLLWVGVQAGADVAQVQQRLQVLHYYRGDVDGIYGNQTRDGVIAFQRDRGLSPDGIVGPVTYEELEKAYDSALGLENP